jgi:putative methionine-R-sulfoxide reductase with GAF domain
VDLSNRGSNRSHPTSSDPSLPRSKAWIAAVADFFPIAIRGLITGRHRADAGLLTERPVTPRDRIASSDLALDQSAEPRDRTLRTLDRISTAALEAGSLEELLERLLHILLDTTESIDTAAILLRENGDLVLRGSVGLEEEPDDESRVPIGEGFSGQIAASQRPLLLHVAASDPQMKLTAIRNKGVRALYGIPLVDRGRVIGVVHMGSVSVSDFSEQDKQLLGRSAAAPRPRSCSTRLPTKRGRARASRRPSPTSAAARSPITGRRSCSTMPCAWCRRRWIPN